MDIHESRAEALRAEIESIKIALLFAMNESERCDLHIRLNACIRESIALIDQRLQSCWAGQTVHAEPAQERHIGEPL